MSYTLLKDWSLEAIKQASELKIIIKNKVETEKITLINQKISQEKYDTIKNIYEETGWVNSGLVSL